MNAKNLATLAAAAAVVSAAAFFLNGQSRHSAPKLNGRKILPDVSIADVSRIEAGTLAIAAGDGGWVVESMHGYPADRSKILENLRRLLDIKVGQTAKGRKIANQTPVALKDAEGKTLASVILGERHPRWDFGRYAEFNGKTVLVADALEAFDGDPKRWCETKIVDSPWISFSSVADPTTSEDATGFATGAVARVTIGSDTNRLVTVGNPLPDGSGRYLRIEGEPWIFVVPSYSAERLIPKPETTTAPETPATEPETPATEPETPATEPETPATEPETPATKPAPATEPETPAAEPAPATEPETPAAEPDPATEPEAPAAEPEAPAAEPAPATEPEAPATKPSQSEQTTPPVAES